MVTAPPRPVPRVSSESAPSKSKPPVLKVTRYDLVWSFMIAIVLGLMTTVVVLTIVWLSVRKPEADEFVPIEMIELGGYEDGAPDESLDLESPAEETDDPSLAETMEEEVQIQETLDNVIELADQASQQLEQQYATADVSSGTPGSAVGTGRRPLGSGGGDGGNPREQRWFIRFGDNGLLDVYARQLDHFGIEMAALFPDGRMVFMSNVSSPTPRTRTIRSGKGEDRLYMMWRGGGRKQADIKLFQKAGLDVSNAVIFHFYPKRAEEMLATAERDYRNRPVSSIRRTYFTVREKGSGYEFAVTRQTYFR